MPAWFYVLAAAAVLFVLWYGWARRWWHALRYSWTRAHHAYHEVEEDYGPGRFYGSMLPDGDFLPAPPVDPDPWLTQRVPDWREQTAADLSPEALDDPYGTELIEAWVRGGMRVNWITDDSGPGDAAGSSSSASPGPDQEPIDMGYLSLPADLQQEIETAFSWQEAQKRWLDGQLADLFAWVRTMHESRVTA